MLVLATYFIWHVRILSSISILGHIVFTPLSQTVLLGIVIKPQIAKDRAITTRYV